MASISYLRLEYCILLALLLAVLGYAFIPSKSRLLGFVERHSNGLAWIMWVGAAFVLWGMGTLKFIGLHNSAADLGLYANTLWVTLHGKPAGDCLNLGNISRLPLLPVFSVAGVTLCTVAKPSVAHRHTGYRGGERGIGALSAGQAYGWRKTERVAVQLHLAFQFCITGRYTL